MTDISLSPSVLNTIQTINRNSSDISDTQERITTGQSVNSPLDNPSAFFAARELSGRSAGFTSILANISASISSVTSAQSQIEDLSSALADTKNALTEALAASQEATASVNVGGDTTQSAQNLFGSSINISITGSNAESIEIGETDTLEDLIAKIESLDNVEARISGSSFQIQSSDGSAFSISSSGGEAGSEISGDYSENNGNGYYSIFQSSFDYARTALSNTGSVAGSADDTTEDLSFITSSSSGAGSAATDDEGADPALTTPEDPSASLSSFLNFQFGGGIPFIAESGANIPNSIDVITQTNSQSGYFLGDNDEGGFTELLQTQSGFQNFASDDGSLATTSFFNSINQSLQTYSNDDIFSIQFNQTQLLSQNLISSIPNTTTPPELDTAALTDSSLSSFAGVSDAINAAENSGDDNILGGDSITTFLNSASDSLLEIQGLDLGLDPSDISEADFSDPAEIEHLIETVEAAEAEVATAAINLETSLDILEAREDFSSEIAATLSEGAVELTSSNPEDDARELLALETQNQLAESSLPIVSSSSVSIASLL